MYDEFMMLDSTNIVIRFLIEPFLMSNMKEYMPFMY